MSQSIHLCVVHVVVVGVLLVWRTVLVLPVERMEVVVVVVHAWLGGCCCIFTSLHLTSHTLLLMIQWSNRETVAAHT